MKIGYAGIELPEGKVKFEDQLLDQLTEKCKPKKVAPYYVELVPDEFDHVDAIAIATDNLLDLLILDMDRCESRMQRAESEAQKAFVQQCLAHLESEKPLCEMELTPAQKEELRSFAMASLKPVVVVDPDTDLNEIIQKVLNKAGIMFFYTAGPKEVHAWDVKKGIKMRAVAGRIHSDLERGFIKGEFTSVAEYMDAHNFNEAKKKGVVKIVDADYELEPESVIEILFNV